MAWNVLPLTEGGLFEPMDMEGQQVEEDMKESGFLWAVPKKRRSVEVRLRKKFGVEKWRPFGSKMFQPKKNIISCPSCGEYHEANYLCPHCYEKVRLETQKVQEAIEQDYQRNEPIDKEMAILYEDDPRDKKEAQTIRLIEVPHKRPAWFSQNLLSKTGLNPKTETNVVEKETPPGPGTSSSS
jgi:large subunit ribosomal protein L32